jgi:hypothetical protein
MNQGLYNHQKTADCMLSNLQDRQGTYNVTLRRVRSTIGAVEKSNKYYIFWVCVCVCLALGAQREMRMRHIVIFGLSGCAVIFHIAS